jgi:dTMP kinase
MRRKLIVFEGIDGAGTTTQTALLHDALIGRGIKAARTFEPTDGPAGALIKQLLRRRLTFNSAHGEKLLEKTLALLFAADRLDHMAQTVLPLTAAGTHVISDRNKLSSLAYQSLDAPLDWVKELNRFAPEPDLLIFLDVPPDAALKRLQIGRHVREIFEEKEKLEKIDANYRRLIKSIPKKNLLVINGTKPVGEVHKIALERVLRAL